MGTGLHATWINSDDMLYKDALYNQVLSRELVGDVVYIGDCVNIDAGGTVLFNHRGRILSLEDLLRVPSVWRSKRYICQQEVLFPLELALRVGGLNERNHYSMDYELWGRLLLAGAKVEYTGIPFGFFRWHAGQKTQDNIKQTESMLDAAETLLAEATFMPEETKDDILAELRTYRAEYPVRAWKTSGRLTRLGLPSAIVVPIRHLRHAVEKRIGSFMRSTK